MNKRSFFSYSILAGAIFMAYPSVSVLAAPALTQSAKASIEAPRSFVLEQPGSPSTLVDKQYRWRDQTPLQSTGFWVEKGETVVVDLNFPGSTLSPAPDFFVTTPDDRTLRYTHAFKKPLKKGQNIIRSEKSGILYIALYNEPIAGDIKINIKSGGKPFARFVAGVHSAQDYQQMLSRFSDVPYVELVGKRMMITLRRDKALKFIDKEGPDEVLKSWDKIVTWAENQYGITEENTQSPHQRIRHRFHWLDGIELPGMVNKDNCAGYMNAGQWRMMACSENAIGDVVSHSKLTSSEDGWGPWHELGHQFQMIPMDWGTWNTEGNMTEVVVNLTSLYVQREMGLPSRLEYDDTWDEYVFPYLKQPSRNYHTLGDSSLLAKVAMLWQLDLTFGKDFYARLGKFYRELPENQQPANSDAKVQLFILETSRVSGYDLTPFFEKWGLPPTQTTKDTIKQLALPWMTDPIWENRDSNIKFDYSKDEAPTVTLDKNKINVVGTYNYGFGYKVTGSSNQDNVNWKWERVEGSDSIYLKSYDKASAEVVVPKNLFDVSAKFRLTATNGDDKLGEAFVIIEVAKPAVTLTGPSSMASASPAKMQAKANFGEVTYQWILTQGSQEIANGIDQHGQIKSGLKAGSYTVEVSAKSDKGARVATTSHQLKVSEQVANNDAAFIKALQLSMSSTDNANSVTFSAGVSSSTAATSPPAYQWTLPSGAEGSNNGQAQQRFTLNKTSQVQNLRVKVRVSAGKETRELEQSIIVPAIVESGDEYPNWVYGGNYKTGDVVTHKGKVFECKVSGWCSQTGQWSQMHYEPEVGISWTAAWKYY